MTPGPQEPPSRERIRAAILDAIVPGIIDTYVAETGAVPESLCMTRATWDFLEERDGDTAKKVVFARALAAWNGKHIPVLFDDALPAMEISISGTVRGGEEDGGAA